jgi:predicted dehydrogenase
MTEERRFAPTAIVTRDPATIGEVAPDGAAADVRVGTDLETVLDDVDCDVVVVCTPVELHARDLRVAFDAGKDVLVEKCLSNDWAEACALVREAEEAGVELVVAQNYRYTVPTQTLHAALVSGDYGAASVVDLAMHKYRPAPRQQNYPFAMFWDQGCHHVDDLQWCLGPITSVTARTFSAPWSRYRDDAAIQAFFTFDSGAHCTYVLSNVGRGNELRWSVHTDAGLLTRRGEEWRWAEALAPDDAPFGWNAPPVAVPPPAGVPPSGEHGVLDALHRAVTQRTPTEISGRANLETLRVCEMVQRAGTLGRKVTRDEVATVA